MSVRDADAVRPPDVDVARLARTVPGANVLVTGPPMTGKFGLMIALLAESRDGGVVISTKHPASTVLGAYGAIADGDVGVVDCVSRPDREPDRRESELIRDVGSVDNLTRIGVEFVELFEALSALPTVDAPGVALHSASTLLVHSDLGSVYRFLGTLTGHVRRSGSRSVVVIETPAPDGGDDVLHHHFDAVVETRRDEQGRPRLRVRGNVGAPDESTWIVF